MKLWPRRDRITLPERVQALEAAVTAARPLLPDGLADSVQAMVDRAGERRQLSVEHTVVALAGATGSGKSSLFNRIAGMEVSRVGVRRPTTADPMACVWGTQGVIPLLDWLDVPPRHRVARESVLDSGESDDLDGLVLLDLPDHDSTQQAHRDTVDRLVEQVDLFVWVLDPQKYADAALHERYLRPLASHQAVTVVVLNQIDRLARGDIVECVTDLRRRLDEDGLDEVPVVALSAVTGEGVDTLVDLIRTAVTKRRAVDERIEADLRMTADVVASAVGAGSPGKIDRGARDALAAAVADASGADVVAEAVGRSYLRRARATTGWPVTRWLGKLRRDPLDKLGVATRRSDEVDAGIARVSLPEPTPVQRARSDAAVRSFGDTAAGSLPLVWRDEVRRAATEAGSRLPAALEKAVTATDFGITRRPRWWRLFNLLQWLALLTAMAGVVWLVALALGDFLRFEVATPWVLGIPVPTLLLAAGVVLGVFLGLVGLAAARRGARHREESMRRALRELVARTVGDVVVTPVTVSLERYGAFRAALERARTR
ncbi:GTP-binding protein [Jiangella asiatica]|uniref:ABC transporter n=1 Tax=Jiangella asiatica TaxID=2530372 RepID=A0A4R5CE02_9ACTN|nr:GTP-binding protein [Jiangella asiatica]TDD98288.1 ABC transporter [Jiangella asiatica]